VCASLGKRFYMVGLYGLTATHPTLITPVSPFSCDISRRNLLQLCSPRPSIATHAHQAIFRSVVDVETLFSNLVSVLVLILLVVLSQMVGMMGSPRSCTMRVHHVIVLFVFKPFDSMI
jgi:hypothetical protein